MSKSVSTASTGFDRFGLKDALMRGIHEAGFDRPRPIQSQTIPAGLAGRDVLGLAQTGTGKTAAFALPLLDRLLDAPPENPRALVLAPTRELASQIAAEIRALSRFTRLKLVTVYGGVPISKDIRALDRRPEIVVGCPGRVLDLLQRGVLKTDDIQTLVLDEADHMFDMGFLPDIRRILSKLPSRRQNLLFSATMPKDVRGLADELLTDPQVVELARTAPAATIEHALIEVTNQEKRALLERALQHEDCTSAIVFTRTKHRARRLAQQLSRAGHRAVGLQGNMSQGQRDRAMRGFRSRQFDVLVATDIAARGIDVSDVSHVINFDVPNTAEAYTHRVGRTGRAEQAGIAITFLTSADRGWLRATERMIGQPIPRLRVEGLGEAKSTQEPAGEPKRNRGQNQHGARANEVPGGRGRNSRGRRRRRRRRRRAA